MPRPLTPRTGLGAALALATVGWIPFMAAPLSPDEAGMLMIGGQWGPGTSLYGDYWVDRPPGLVVLYGAADVAGGAWPLRTLGVLLVLASVLAGAAIGRAAVPASRTAPALCAAVVAVLVANPLFGGGTVNGEIAGLPFVLAGVAAVLRSRGAATARSGFGWGVVAGVAGGCGMLAKQNLVDTFVLVGALLVLQWRPRQGRHDVLTRTFAGASVGGAATLALAVGVSWLRGTRPGPLWEAVVTFRGEAAAKILSDAVASNSERMVELVGAFLLSGAPLLLVLVAVLARRPLADRPGTGTGPGDLRWAAAIVLTWEVVAAYLGGSYWLHYLIGLIPGIALAVAAAAQRGPVPRRPLLAILGAMVASTLVTTVVVLIEPLAPNENDVIAYLRPRVQPGDTGTVAFGASNILEATGLESPYPDLWSLPVRVRDPDLAHFAEVLAGPDRPTWLILSGRTLATWGIDTTRAEPYVEQYYEPVAELTRFTVLRLKD